MRALVAGLVITAAIAASSRARANGRFPFANQLVVAPKDASHMALRTTYGFLQSFDAGKSWVWLCEKSVGYGGAFDPAIGITASDTLLAGVFDGLRVSRDRGCDWAVSGEPLDGEYIIDLVVERGDPMRAVALTSSGIGDGKFRVFLGETTDGGKTWAKAGVDLPTDLNSETLEVAPSDPNRIYVSGTSGTTPRKGVIERSDDRGKTWTRTEVPLDRARTPFISAVHPTRPDTLWIRVDGDITAGETGLGDRLLVSEDGAKTFRDVASVDGNMFGFALSPDGSRIAIGGSIAGLLTASTSDHAFRQTSSVAVRCLTWTSDALFICGTEYPDNFTVGKTNDEGKTIQPVYTLSNLAPLNCSAGTSTATRCPADWPAVRDTIGVPLDDAGSVKDAGAGAAGIDDAGKGCGCSAAGARRASLAFAALAVALAGLARLVRRRR